MKRQVSSILQTIFILFLLFVSSNGFAQEQKVIKAIKNGKPPKINGKLTEKTWDKAVSASNFTQYRPYNGEDASFESEVKIIYDDEAIYFGAKLYDPHPDSIFTELGNRDFRGIKGHGASRLNADIFSILLSPYNDGVNMIEFSVSASGVQSDVKHIGRQTDYNWDAVWCSSVRVTDYGWVAEVKIPYAALRFPNELKKNWGMHLLRHVRRYNEWDSWSYIDIDQQGIVNQAGELSNIHDINPPLRLSFTPYLSSYIEKGTDSESWSSNIRGGMDLKYGINESFTLDMTLIPDFGQVEEEDRVLNLSPFEVKYQEKRPFFTEGTELFDKGGIFYSQRIGGEPDDYYDVYDKTDSNETVVKNPHETRMVNATKLSGRTDNGLGIGFLNAMTSASRATIKDTITGEKRKEVTQPFTNYNMMVFDQSLKNNSYVSLVNTNVTHFSGNYMANVTGTEFKLANEANSYQIDGDAAISQKYKSNNAFGHKYSVNFRKTQGNFRFELGHNTESDTYDPNDLGYLRNNNEFSQEVELSYNIYDPFSVFLSIYNNLDLQYSSLYKPRKFQSFEVRWFTQANFKNQSELGVFMLWQPESHDYFEPRVNDWDWKFKRPQHTFIRLWGGTDNSKDISLRAGLEYMTGARYNRTKYQFELRPTFRFSDRLSLEYHVKYDKDFNDVGYVGDSEFNDGQIPPVFGKRNVQTFINSMESSFKFTNRMLLNFRLRHYWRSLDYKKLYDLKKTGYLSDELNYSKTEIDQANLNYNAFNLYLQYLWHFAPGSELSVVWKNNIYATSEDIPMGYFNNLEDVLSSSQVNSISVKLIYYLDYQQMKEGFGVYR